MEILKKPLIEIILSQNNISFKQNCLIKFTQRKLGLYETLISSSDIAKGQNIVTGYNFQ